MYESESPIVIIITSIVSLVVGALGSWIAWRRGENSKESEFRDDLLKFNAELREEIENLKARVAVLEADLHIALKTTRAWELKFAKAKLVLFKRHQLDLDLLLIEEGEIVEENNASR